MSQSQSPCVVRPGKFPLIQRADGLKGKCVGGSKKKRKNIVKKRKAIEVIIEPSKRVRVNPVIAKAVSGQKRKFSGGLFSSVFGGKRKRTA